MHYYIPTIRSDPRDKEDRARYESTVTRNNDALSSRIINIDPNERRQKDDRGIRSGIKPVNYSIRDNRRRSEPSMNCEETRRAAHRSTGRLIKNDLNTTSRLYVFAAAGLGVASRRVGV